MTTNLLANEASPYLQQHKDNPVHWVPWTSDALAQAKQENKPILLSIGYAACHWCHVMAHESFENPEIAALMNTLFVNIKVDREERPDLDAIYQSALALLGEQGGWPLTMFLTPDGHPFWGGTYFPPTARYGRPGFPDVLNTIAKVYREDPEKVAKNVSALGDALNQMSQPRQAAWAGLQTLDQVDGIAEAALQMIDFEHGGTRGAPKFPQPSFFSFLWRSYLRTGTTELRDAVTITLDHLCQGGIYDHLGGGFARYSTDPYWLAPHFEKMLYDNAQLLELLSYVWAKTGSALYAARVQETVDWLLREMRLEGGAFAGTLDADSEGREGTFYVWDEAEIEDLIGPDAAAFKRTYDVSPGGNWEGKTILNRLRAMDFHDEETEANLATQRAALFQARTKRERPGLDDKVLADWNGLMISGLAIAGSIFNQPDWIAAARNAFAFVEREMTIANRLIHTWRGGIAKPGDVIDDYAQMARAALLLFEATAEETYIERAKDWIATANEFFWDPDGGSYFFSPSDANDLIVRTRTPFDNATPAGNGTLVEVLARLHYLTGKAQYRDNAERIVVSFTATAGEQLVNLPSLLNGFEFLAAATQVVIITDPSDPEGRRLRDIALASGLPSLVVMSIAPDAILPGTHPAAGKAPVGGKATAYVCVGQACGLPVSEAETLKLELARREPGM